MGLRSFMKDAGEKILANAKAAASFNPGRKAQAQQPAGQGAPAPAQSAARKDNVDEAGAAIENYIRVQGLEVDNLDVRFDSKTSTVHVSGTAKDQATKEKVILCCGNVEGVEHVNDELDVKEQAPAAQFHTVVSGDTLSAIAKKFFGDANKYPIIFEANKPMLTSPDKIYPGQTLRIPPMN